MIRVAAFPFGCHVCEVEVDPDTGLTEIVRYAAVDDVGRAVNPLILHGQTHGAIVQGVGQALWEQCSYDAETGQLLSGSMMDYAMPRADMLPSFATALGETPAPSNPLGVRAGGEGGTTPALGVVANAVVDALARFGVTHIELPLTSEKVWRAMHAATALPLPLLRGEGGERRAGCGAPASLERVERPLTPTLSPQERGEGARAVEQEKTQVRKRQ